MTVDVVTGTVFMLNATLGQNGTVNNPVVLDGLLKY